MSVINCKWCEMRVDTDFNSEHEDECVYNPANRDPNEDPDDDGEMWRRHRDHGRQKKQNNEVMSLQILRERGIAFKSMRGDAHYRVGDWDFWPSTGKFYNPKTGERGRGVFNLLKKL